MQEAEAIVNYHKNGDHDDDGEDWINGENIAGELIGYTGADDIKDALGYIKKINAKNVFITLAGYEDNDANGNDIITQIMTEDMTSEKKREMVRHILKAAKQNLEAQLIVESKKKEDEQDSALITQLQEDISELDSYISSGVEKTNAAEVDVLLNKYIEDTHLDHGTQGWLGEAFDSVGNFFENLFNWF